MKAFIKKHSYEIFLVFLIVLVIIAMFHLIVNFQEYGGFRQIIIDAGRDVLAIIEEIKK